jgi:hypothetical protein
MYSRREPHHDLERNGCQFAQHAGPAVAQNPIADLISVPFQNNTNFDIGHTDNAQNVLNIQLSIRLTSMRIGT